MVSPSDNMDKRSSDSSSWGQIKARRHRRALRRDPRAHHADPSVRRAIYNDVDDDPRDPQVPRSDTPRSHTKARQMSLPEGSSSQEMVAEPHARQLSLPNPTVHSDPHDSPSSDPDIFLISRLNPGFTFASPGSQRGASEPKDVFDGATELSTSAAGDCRHKKQDSKDIPKSDLKFSRSKGKRNSSDRRSSDRSTHKKKKKGKSALNEPLPDCSVEVHHTKHKEVKSLDRGSNARVSNNSVMSSSSFPSSFLPSGTSRSVTPSTFYTPDSSRRSSLTELTELSGATSEDVLDKLSHLPLDEHGVTEDLEHPSLAMSLSDPSVGPCDSSACLLSSPPGGSSPVPPPAPVTTPCSSSSSKSPSTHTDLNESAETVVDNKSKTKKDKDEPRGAKSKASLFLGKLFRSNTDDEGSSSSHTAVNQSPSTASSQQSSVVGLDWLFCSDSDSGSSSK